MNGKFITKNFMNREISIYLPPSYSTCRAGFPVVYVQDGGYLFNPHENASIQILEQMFAHKEIEELLLVGIESKNRIDEYTPWHAKALIDRYADFGGGGGEYLSCLVEKLKPWVDHEFNAEGSTESTGIIGGSLGGLISMYAAYKYPAVFGKIGSISGSFWYEGFVEFMKSEPVENSRVKVYMDVGSSEGVEKQNVQKEMVQRTKAAYDALLLRGVSEDRCRLLIEEGAIHKPSFFSKRFPGAIQWLFSGAKVKR